MSAVEGVGVPDEALVLATVMRSHQMVPVTAGQRQGWNPLVNGYRCSCGERSPHAPYWDSRANPVHSRWFTDVHVPAVATSALPSLREAIAAEVLGPIREAVKARLDRHNFTESWDRGYLQGLKDAIYDINEHTPALSAPVQAACPECHRLGPHAETCFAPVQAAEPTCTCGAVEYGAMAQHLTPCPLAPVQAAEPRNPHLPQKPADGQHVYGRSPSDIGGNRRCLQCGAYRGSVESERTCEGEWAESGKMRAWASEKWKQERAVQAAEEVSRVGVLRDLVSVAHEEQRQAVSQGRDRETLTLFQHWSATAGWLSSRVRAYERGDDPDMPDAMRVQAAEEVGGE